MMPMHEIERAIQRLEARFDEHKESEEKTLKDMAAQLAEIYQGWPAVYGAAMGRSARLNALEERVHRLEFGHLYANGSQPPPNGNGASTDEDDEALERTATGKHVKVPIERAEAQRAELASLRDEVGRLRRRVDDSGLHNLRAVELAAEAKGIAEGKTKTESLPPLVRPIVLIVTKVGSHLAKDWAKHAVTLALGAGAAWVATHWGRLLQALGM